MFPASLHVFWEKVILRTSVRNELKDSYSVNNPMDELSTQIRDQNTNLNGYLQNDESE